MSEKEKNEQTKRSKRKEEQDNNQRKPGNEASNGISHENWIGE
jgi:hypothetical protein